MHARRHAELSSRYEPIADQSARLRIRAWFDCHPLRRQPMRRKAWRAIDAYTHGHTHTQRGQLERDGAGSDPDLCPWRALRNDPAG